MKLGQEFADFVRGMTRLDAHRLRDLMGEDDLQKFADLLGVDIETGEEREIRTDYEAIADASMQRCRELEVENKKLREQLAAPTGAKARAAE